MGRGVGAEAAVGKSKLSFRVWCSRGWTRNRFQKLLNTCLAVTGNFVGTLVWVALVVVASRGVRSVLTRRKGVSVVKVVRLAVVWVGGEACIDGCDPR